MKNAIIPEFSMIKGVIKDAEEFIDNDKNISKAKLDEIIEICLGYIRRSINTY